MSFFFFFIITLKVVSVNPKSAFKEKIADQLQKIMDDT